MLSMLMPGGATWCLAAVLVLHLRHAVSLTVSRSTPDFPEAGLWSVPSKPTYSLLNFSEPGLCYAEPLQGVFQENWELIGRNVRLGRQRAKDMRVIFAGLIRSAEESAYRSFAMLKNIGLQFKEYHFLVFENDSADRTVEVMKLIAKKDRRYEFKTEVLSMGNERALEGARMTRMATVRNKVHDMIEAFIRTSPGWDLIFMYDYDLNQFGQYAVSPHAVFNALGRQESLQGDWDMLCANSLIRQCASRHCRAGMYDVFAFREVHKNAWSYEKTRHFYNQYQLEPVDSCFGGLAMYRPEAFLPCRYDTKLDDCEHVGLHRCMREKGSQGRMFMDPLLSTSADMFVDLKCLADANLTV